MKKLKLFSIYGSKPVRIKIDKWSSIPWPRIREKVLKLQRVIYNASKIGNTKKVRRFQHLILNSTDAKELAVRRVTQDNTGKNTAGVDGIKSLTPVQRRYLVSILSIPRRSRSLRRIWIPKPGTDEKRPLGIPTLIDRATQALFKLALEPEWEAKFENNSYGFRPGRSCIDALAAIRSFIREKPKYVIDADISKCFDRIDHNALLNKIGMKGNLRKQLHSWLKAGILDNDTFSETNEGTPQGGVISPLLANIALHGLGNHLAEFVERFPMTFPSGRKLGHMERIKSLGMVRYADDFVVIHHDKQVTLACLEETKRWLSKMGLELNEKKTRLTHTLKLQEEDVGELFDGVVGFNFLGYTIKQFESKYRSVKDSHGRRLGFKTLMYPSKKSIDKHQAKLHSLILIKGKSLNQHSLIKLLNPVIRGWANYFGHFDTSTMHFLTKMDHLLYLKLRHWAKRITSGGKKSNQFFHTIGSNKWTFATKENVILVNHLQFSTPTSQIVKVKGDESPYSSSISYWKSRTTSVLMQDTRVKFLSNKQKGICKFCKRPFYWNDLIEIDHIIPRRLGGSDNTSNLQALHRHCHDTKTALENSKNKPTPPPIQVPNSPSATSKSIWMSKPKRTSFTQRKGKKK